MLKKVTITNYLGDKVEYKIDGCDVYKNNGIIITDIEGLGPVKANINMTKLATYDGELYNSAILDGRNIVIHAIFTWCDTVEESRLSSYKFFPLKKTVTFEIETEHRKAYTIGYVESNEPSIFSEEPDPLEMQISLVCESPFFLDSRGIDEKIFSDVEPLFEFVYENPHPTTKLTEISDFQSRRQCSVWYDGDSESAFDMVIHAIGTVGNFWMYSIRTGDYIYIDKQKMIEKTGSGIIEGDDIILSSYQGKKKALLLRNGEYTSILTLLGKNPKWFNLVHGENIFSYISDYGEENVRVYVRVQPQFDGV